MRLLISFLLCLNSMIVIGQKTCELKEIFPVDLGLTKYNTSKFMATLNNYKENADINKWGSYNSRWEKPKYLNGDSVFKSYLNYTFESNKCLSGSENNIQYRFVDDKLYFIYLTLRYSNSEYLKSEENYNAIIDLFKKNFPEWNKSEPKNSKTNEQLGEGFYFYPKLVANRDNIKVGYININYEIEHIGTGNNTYLIIIEFVNLNGTKLTGEGF